MLDHLIQLDRHLFYWINHDLTNPFFDAVMPWARTPRNWIPLFILISAYCLWKYRAKGIIIIAFIGISAGVADFTSASIVKPLVHRLRPCADPVTAPTDIERVSACGSGYSFPSTHATDYFAVAIFMVLIFRKYWHWIWFWGIFWAGLISFAQVYVGVHYPIDVTCGAIYGSFVGWFIYWVFRKLQRRYPEWMPAV
ncbi:undecaprenyl-diphosphatase [Mucilaginibacter mallensis]|uniref:Undecaprenyl-diphosphatase n=1 Tax=Mucilaginibacter mallensis TaxID=652787 RepID=A0A1H1UP89_MUCMA|nr:phosphatase PAP2 family protein [Mucilaginibacter mallensis]SDS74364.1 undecaprenyl-diphosphatase [Mucilaginibacter mallensis]